MISACGNAMVQVCVDLPTLPRLDCSQYLHDFWGVPPHFIQVVSRRKRYFSPCICPQSIRCTACAATRVTLRFACAWVSGPSPCSSSEMSGHEGLHLTIADIWTPLPVLSRNLSGKNGGELIFMMVWMSFSMASSPLLLQVACVISYMLSLEQVSRRRGGVGLNCN